MIDVDENLVETEEGVWTEFRGTALLITHTSNMAFQRKLARLQQPHAKKIERGTLSPDLQRDILCQAMAGTILKDAKFVRVRKDEQNNPLLDDNGRKQYDPVEFSEKYAKQVLIKQVDVREFVSEYSANLDNYRQEAVEDLGKS